jgi:hypothetical protein
VREKEKEEKKEGDCWDESGSGRRYSCNKIRYKSNSTKKTDLELFQRYLLLSKVLGD